MPTIADAIAANAARIATQGDAPRPAPTPRSPAAPPLADPPADRPRRGNFPQSMIAVDTFEKVTGQFFGRMRARALTSPGGSDLPSNASSIGTSKTTVVTQVPTPDIDPFLKFRGNWSSTVTYFTNDVVIDNLSAYVAIAGSLGVEPDKGNTSNWSLLSKNLNFRGVFATLASGAMRQNFSVQAANGNPTNGAFASSVLSGSKIVVSTIVQNVGASAVPVITDSQGNSYTNIVNSIRVDGNEYQTQTWIATTSSAGALTVLVSYTGGGPPGFAAMFAAELTGLASSPVDASTSAGATGNSGAFPSMSLSVASAGEFIYTAVNNPDASLAAPAGYSSHILNGGGIAWLTSAPSGSNTVQWGGSFNNSNTRFTATAVSFSLAPTAVYNPYDYVEYKGSMWVCVVTTSTAPTPSNTSWQLLAQGVGFVNSKTANYTAVAADQGSLISFNSSSAVTLTLPATPPNSGWVIAVENIGTGALTVNPNGATLDGSSSSLTFGTNQGTWIFNNGTNYFTLRGLGSPSLNVASAIFTDSQVNQSGNLRQFGNVLTAGLYRVSVYMVIADPGTGNLAATITWNDGFASQTVTPATISTTPVGMVAQFNLEVLLDGIHDLSYTITLS